MWKLRGVTAHVVVGKSSYVYLLGSFCYYFFYLELGNVEVKLGFSVFFSQLIVLMVGIDHLIKSMLCICQYPDN